MSKGKVNNSMENNEILIDSNKGEEKKTVNKSIYEAGKSYYNYLKKMKLDDFEDDSDYSAAFMMF